MRSIFFLLMFASFSASSQTYPSKPLRIVVPFPAGGIVDLMARAFSDKLGAQVGQPVVVEARSGANASIGTEAVAKAEPDGHTVLLATISHVTVPAMTKVSWHPLKDFSGVAWVGHVANIAVAAPTLQVTTLKEVVAAAKAQPGRIHYVNAGNGTSQTLTVELLKRNTGTDLVPVGYRGHPPAIPDLLSGEVQFAFVPFAVVAPHVRSGKLRGLAIAAPSRSKQFPDLPTMAEAGFPDSQVISWYALLAPSGTPRGAVARLNAEMRQALADPEVAARIDKLGGEVLAPQTPEQIDATLAREVERWARLLKEINLRLD